MPRTARLLMFGGAAAAAAALALAARSMHDTGTRPSPTPADAMPSVTREAPHADLAGQVRSLQAQVSALQAELSAHPDRPSRSEQTTRGKSSTSERRTPPSIDQLERAHHLLEVDPLESEAVHQGVLAELADAELADVEVADVACTSAHCRIELDPADTALDVAMLSGPFESPFVAREVDSGQGVARLLVFVSKGPEGLAFPQP